MTEEDYKLAARTILSEYVSPTLEAECPGVHAHIVAEMADLIEEQPSATAASEICQTYLNLNPEHKGVFKKIWQEVDSIIYQSKHNAHETSNERSGQEFYPQALPPNGGERHRIQPKQV